MRERRLLAGLVAILIGIAIAATALRGVSDRRGAGEPRAAAATLRLGIVANTQDTRTGEEQDEARALGASIIREELRWPDVEPKEGRWDDSRYDALTRSAAQRGLQILPLLFQSPAWLSDDLRRLPPSLPRWQRFVRHVVERYAPGGRFWREHPELDGNLAMTTWEVWNEPYLGTFSAGDVDPVAYARLARATVEAGREANPRARFLAAVETLYRARDGTVRNWADDMFAADRTLAPLLGGVAVHPYSPLSPLTPAAAGEFRFARTNELLENARRNGVAVRRPLWITELGWSTCTFGSPCVSRRNQALYWAQALDLIERPPLRGNVAAVLGYSLRDIRGDGPDDPLADFGLLTSTGDRKPAWDVIHRAALTAPRTGP